MYKVMNSKTDTHIKTTIFKNIMVEYNILPLLAIHV